MFLARRSGVAFIGLFNRSPASIYRVYERRYSRRCTNVNNDVRVPRTREKRNDRVTYYENVFALLSHVQNNG